MQALDPSGKVCFLFPDLPPGLSFGMLSHLLQPILPCSSQVQHFWQLQPNVLISLGPSWAIVLLQYKLLDSVVSHCEVTASHLAGLRRAITSSCTRPEASLASTSAAARRRRRLSFSAAKTLHTKCRPMMSTPTFSAPAVSARISRAERWALTPRCMQGETLYC